MGNSEFHQILRAMEKIILTALLLASSQVAGHGKYRYYSSKSTGKYYSSNNRGYSSNNRGYSSSSGGYSSSPRQSRQAGNIVEELTNNGASTLIDLAVKAGLADTLTGGGPFTVFAPTNAAFAALPADLVAAVTSDVEMLKKVLLYHVVPGTVTSDQARNGVSLKTVEGTSVKINVYKNWKYGSTIKVNGKKVVKADVKASNGVIHFIDGVLTIPTTGGRSKYNKY